MAFRFVVPFVLVAACKGPTTEPPLITPPDVSDDTDPHADDTDSHPPAVDNRRPLCKEPAVTVPMATDVKRWSDECVAGPNRFVGDQNLTLLDALGETALGATNDEIIRNRIRRGYERLRAGFTDRAIADLQIALDLSVSTASPWRGRARELLALAWMRRAELDNCVAMGVADACLVPFSEAALHVMEEGMENASALWQDFLAEDDPTKASPRWLLNVCHMALGDYPSAVPEQWRPPADALLAEAELPAWENVARDLNVAVPDNAGTASMEDFDGDGLLDILFTSHHPKVGMRLYLNQGDGGFCDASVQSGLSTITGVLHGSVEDFDNDGHFDIAAPRAGWYAEEGFVRISLMKNDGLGHFTDVAVAAGLDNVTGPSQVAAWGDVDGDGWLDLFVGREKAGSVFPPASLYMNQGDGTFVDEAVQRGVATNGFVKGAAFGDMDNDGDPDLYVSTFAGDNHLYRNDRHLGTFREVTAGARAHLPRNGFSTFWFDYDQDGWLDLFASGYPVTFVSKGPLHDDFNSAADGFIADLFDQPTDVDPAHVYHNLRDGFEDVRDRLGLNDVLLPMGSNFGDLDSDGWPDIYIGTGAAGWDALTPNVAYRNDGGVRFLDVTTATRLGHLQKGHGIAFGDLDDDGDEDILADIGGAFTGDIFADAVFINPTVGAHNVTLRLEGVTSPRSGTGARVRVVTPERTWHHVVGMDSSFGNNSHQLEVGLGASTSILRVEIDWPNSDSVTLDTVPIDHVVHIREGVGIVSSRPHAPLVLGHADGHEEP